MIKFFRRIRQKFLSENNFSKYLIYAIGEIILVVVGILIALQINNWNENRILLKKENHYLNEIITNLEGDITKINEILNFNQIKDSLLDDTINPLMDFEGDDEITQVIAKNFQSNSEYNVFEQNNAAYTNMLQAENIGLIQNDTLRQKLTYYYQQNEELKTGTALRIKGLTREFTDISVKLIFNKSTITQIIGRENNWPIKIELNREDKANILSYLINIKDNIYFYNIRLNRVMEEAQELRKSIVNNLKK
ncbi:DUF6090 family protein [Aegicerativicinus sediminis]|uniref:DUF6090 family protein n=1 Tax=Aegicerativicinus sediminis TaxID=2893202 RepID=UPI001E547945|nr:DUF6090 family protein [Aegicerativicinus sediminis]